jgi:hypothetical protein
LTGRGLALEAAMKIYVDRCNCNLSQGYCDRHVAKLIRFPEGEDRPCVSAIEDDGSSELTLIVKTDAGVTTLALTPEERQIAAYEGLSTFLPQ